MKNLSIKIIVGFRKDQHYSIPADDAHRAYWLFLHPEDRGIFSNGLALTGRQIQAIEPDYNATMGWNPDHVLDADDWVQIRAEGIDRKIRDMLAVAKSAAQRGDKAELSAPLAIESEK